MKRIRPWLYFVFFVLILAALSMFRETFPDVYARYALMATTIIALGIVTLSVVTLHRRGRPTDPTDGGGFGMANLPLPKSWKRWVYDERDNKKKNSN